MADLDLSKLFPTWRRLAVVDFGHAIFGCRNDGKPNFNAGLSEIGIAIMLDEQPEFSVQQAVRIGDEVFVKQDLSFETPLAKEADDASS